MGLVELDVLDVERKIEEEDEIKKTCKNCKFSMEYNGKILCLLGSKSVEVLVLRLKKIVARNIECERLIRPIINELKNCFGLVSEPAVRKGRRCCELFICKDCTWPRCERNIKCRLKKMSWESVKKVMTN